ncbi:MAG: GNAT family N-acetyltransferase [Clostridia bacterium]|nr:GNAT family N-acetyltransferase [Clostridia bacterium]
MIRIIPYEEKYRDDMIFMILEAKNALGRVPSINRDLLDIPGKYFSRGDAFWLALDEHDRVVGSIGYNRLDEENARLHRLYVKYSMKRQGIGTALLKKAENAIRARGIRYATAHLGGKEYFESRLFYPVFGYTEDEPGYMKKALF